MLIIERDRGTGTCHTEGLFFYLTQIAQIAQIFAASQLRLRRYSGHTEITESTERLFKLHDAIDANGTVGYLKRQMPKTNYFNAYPQAVSRRLRDAH